MTSDVAYQLDRAGGFWADPIDAGDYSGTWGVFGDESGFCYSTWSTESEARERAQEMERSR